MSSEKISATGQDRKTAAELVARACGLTGTQAATAMATVDSRKYGWSLEVSGPGGKADLIRYGGDNYTVKIK